MITKPSDPIRVGAFGWDAERAHVRSPGWAPAVVVVWLSSIDRSTVGRSNAIISFTSPFNIITRWKVKTFPHIQFQDKSLSVRVWVSLVLFSTSCLSREGRGNLHKKIDEHHPNVWGFFWNFSLNFHGFSFFFFFVFFGRRIITRRKIWKCQVVIRRCIQHYSSSSHPYLYIRRPLCDCRCSPSWK